MGKLFVSIALVLFILIPAGGLAQSSGQPEEAEEESGGLYLLGKDGQLQPAPVMGSAVHLEVTGIVARGRVTQLFYNPGKKGVEAVYVFPLPEDAAVDALRLTVGGRVLEGQIRENEEARQGYQQAQEEGKKASLLEQQRPNVFTLSVAHVGPGETVIVELELQQLVQRERGRFRLRFPLVVAERYRSPSDPNTPVKSPPVLPAGFDPVNPVAIRVDLDAGFPVRRLESPSHAVTAVRQQGFRYAVELAKGTVPASSDFVLEWEPEKGTAPRATLYAEEFEGEQYVLVMVLPPAVPKEEVARLPRETVFVIDTSGSMGGEPLAQARQALAAGLQTLRPEDRFDVIRFSSTAESFFGQSVPADPAVVEQAVRRVQGLQVDGGTEMLPALQLALRPAAGSEELRQVIFATDGQVSNEAQLFDYLKSHLGDQRLFTVGIGAAPNGRFMRKAAELGRGTFTFIDRPERVGDEMAALFAKIEAPVMRDLEARWDDPSAEAWPERLPDLYLGEPVVIAARLSDRSGRVALSGERAGEPWQVELPLAGAVPGTGIARLWARRKVESLTDSLFQGADRGEVRRAVTELGLRHHLVTDYTSLLAVDVTPTAPAGEAPAAYLIPVHRPQAAAIDPVLSSGSVVTEEIVVTGDVPEMSATTLNCPFLFVEPDALPGSPDPWMALPRSPGVTTQPSPARQGWSPRPPVFTGPGASPDQNIFQVDRLDVTDGTDPGRPAFIPGPARVNEVEVVTGGAEASLATPGAQVRLHTGRGSNGLDADAFYSWGGHEGSSASPEDARGQVDEAGRYGLKVGGPIRLDRLWFFGALQGGDATVESFGQSRSTRSAHGIARLDTQPLNSSSTYFALTGYGMDLSEDGVGAGPRRAPEATGDLEDRARVWRVSTDHIAAANVYLSGSYASIERRLRELPQGEAGVDAWVDPAGVLHGSSFGMDSDRRTRDATLVSEIDLSGSRWSHDLDLGASGREHDDDSTFLPPGRVVLAGETLGLDRLAPGVAVLEAWQGGHVASSSRTLGLWTQDSLRRDNLTLVLGARLDAQNLTSGRGSDVRWQEVSPRLALLYQGDLSIRATLGRFASRLGTGLLSRFGGSAPGVERFLFTDADGDLALDGSEEASLVSWYTARSIASEIAPDLGSEITEEASLSVEHSRERNWTLGVQATWRQVQDILEERLLVRDTTTGEVFAATGGDWLPAGTVSGSLPDGTSYDVPFFDLRDGLELAGGTRLVNGDRRQEYMGVSLYGAKHFYGDWWIRGHVTWQDREWSLGPEFRRFDDPTNVAGSGDDDGRPVDGPAVAAFGETATPLAGRWSFHLDGMVSFGRGFRFAAVVDGRQGFAIPYYRRVARPRAGLVDVQIAGPATVRTRDLVTLDTRLEKSFWQDHPWGLTVSLEALNVLDADTVTAREADLGVTRGGAPVEALAPRTFRIGARFRWY